MSLKIRVDDGKAFTTTVVLEGRLDNETASDFDLRLDQVLLKAVKVLVFDLSGLEYISSAGLRSIFKAERSMRTRSGKLLLLKPKPQVQKVFDIVKATDLGLVFRNVEELDRYLDAMQKQVIEGE